MMCNPIATNWGCIARRTAPKAGVRQRISRSRHPESPSQDQKRRALLSPPPLPHLLLLLPSRQPAVHSACAWKVARGARLRARTDTQVDATVLHEAATTTRQLHARSHTVVRALFTRHAPPGFVSLTWHICSPVVSVCNSRGGL